MSAIRKKATTTKSRINQETRRKSGHTYNILCMHALRNGRPRCGVMMQHVLNKYTHTYIQYNNVCICIYIHVYSQRVIISR